MQQVDVAEAEDGGDGEEIEEKVREGFGLDSARAEDSPEEKEKKEKPSEKASDR